MDNPTDDRQPFTKDTLMGDAMAHAPNLPVVLMQFHIGGCNRKIHVARAFSSI